MVSGTASVLFCTSKILTADSGVKITSDAFFGRPRFLIEVGSDSFNSVTGKEAALAKSIVSDAAAVSEDAAVSNPGAGVVEAASAISAETTGAGTDSLILGFSVGVISGAGTAAFLRVLTVGTFRADLAAV